MADKKPLWADSLDAKGTCYEGVVDDAQLSRNILMTLLLRLVQEHREKQQRYVDLPSYQSYLIIERCMWFLLA